MLILTGNIIGTKCGNVLVLQCINKQHIKVKFEDGTIVETNYVSLKKGYVSNPNASIAQDVKHNNSKCVWLRIMRAVRGGDSIDAEWLDYDAFDKFYCSMVGYENGWEFTRRLLVPNSNHWGVETCVLLPLAINRNLNSGNKRKFVRKVRNKYISVCCVQEHSVNSMGFDTEEEAFLVYKKTKELEIARLANLYHSLLDARAYKALLNYIVAKCEV